MKSTGRTVMAFAAVAIVVALGGLGVCRMAFPATWFSAGGWLAAAWGLMTLTHMVGGALLVRRHGSPGVGFLAVLVLGMLVRVVLAVGGAVQAFLVSREAGLAWTLGLAASFVPLQLLEVIWFARTPSGDPVGLAGPTT